MSFDGDGDLGTAARLPTELCHYVIDLLRSDPVSIRTCCLVSKAWLPRAQICLYHTIQLLDDMTANFNYIREYAPYVTMRMRAFRYFLVSRTPLHRHIRRLRIGCFWHDDPESWLEFVEDWISLPLLETLAVTHLQVHIHSKQNLGALLQVLALRLPDTTDLDLFGRFAEARDMALSISAFAKLRRLQFDWYGPMEEEMRAVLTTGASTWPNPPAIADSVMANGAALPLLLEWFDARGASSIGDVFLASVSPDELLHGDLMDSVLSCVGSAARHVIGLHINALDEPLSPEAAREIHSVLILLPRTKFLFVSCAYDRDTPVPEVPTAAGRSMHAYDPVWSLADIFSPVPTGPGLLSLAVLYLQMQLSAADLDLLWYHDWSALDLRTRILEERGYEL